MTCEAREASSTLTLRVIRDRETPGRYVGVPFVLQRDVFGTMVATI